MSATQLANTLIEKMRRAREVQAEALGHNFTLRIPNPGEMEDVVEGLTGKRLTYRRILVASVVGWNLNEIDLIPGGNPTPAEFSAELFAEWLNDNESAVEPLFTALSAGMEARRAAKDNDAKN
jgi:hypothetical protein